MTNSDGIILTLLIFVTAVLYSAVGQAGATGYLAAMALVGVDAPLMRPTALALNILVAGIGTARFARAGHFQWRVFYPFVILGIPLSFVGGAIHMPAQYYYPVVGVILLLAAFQLFRSAMSKTYSDGQIWPAIPPFWPAVMTGGVIGLVSGVTGAGGGIFLAPIILLLGWVDPKRTAAVSAAFNLFNSVAALAGAWTALKMFPPALPLWMAAAGVGGLIGSWFGSSSLNPRTLRLILAFVLALAGLKMVIS